LSRAQHPKQFLSLIGPESLFQQTVHRVQGLGLSTPPPIVVCNADHRFYVAEQLRQISVNPEAIMLEPAGRNTAPAVAVAALQAQAASGDIDPTLLVLPADHVIRDADSFYRAVESAVRVAARGRLVTFGIVPDKPETGYGYLRKGKDHGNWCAVDQFVEKPDLETASQYLASGEYLWNSGIFVFSAHAYLDELKTHEPAMLAACERAVAKAQRDQDFLRLGADFLDCRSDSIDYAVMEKARNVALVALDAGWSDVGSWAALHDVLDKDSTGNVLVGNVLLEGTKECYVASTSRLVAAVGLENIIIVETDDAVLVMNKSQSQQIKRVIDRLKRT